MTTSPILASELWAPAEPVAPSVSIEFEPIICMYGFVLLDKVRDALFDKGLVMFACPVMSSLYCGVLVPSPKLPLLSNRAHSVTAFMVVNMRGAAEFVALLSPD